MATPIVAGVLARGLSQGMTRDEAIQRLIETSDRIAGWQGVNTAGGIINILAFHAK